METIDSLYYVLTDHHGSWEKVMDEGKNTGHEHHSHFGLINMKFTLSERSAKLFCHWNVKNSPESREKAKNGAKPATCGDTTKTDNLLSQTERIKRQSL